MDDHPKLLKSRQVEQKVGLERSAIYAKMRTGDFPQPIRIGPKSVRWFEHELDGWIADKAAARDTEGR